MLPGFEKYTHKLTKYEHDVLLPVFLKGFNSKPFGVEYAVTAKEIVEKLSPKYKISEPRVRKIINFIRNKCLIPELAASSNGYYKSRDAEDVKRYIKSLDGRISAVQHIKERMLQYLNSIQQTS